MKQKIQLLEKEVPKANAQVSISDELDKDYDQLTGISFLSNIGKDHLLASSSLEGVDLFEKNFEVDFLQTDSSVPPDERFFTLHGREAKGKTIDLSFQDGGTASSYPYTLKIYLRLENGHKKN